MNGETKLEKFNFTLKVTLFTNAVVGIILIVGIVNKFLHLI